MERPARGAFRASRWRRRCALGRVKQRVLAEPQYTVNVVGHHDEFVEGDTGESAWKTKPDAMHDRPKARKAKAITLELAE